jgi:hypothetical protein
MDEDGGYESENARETNASSRHELYESAAQDVRLLLDQVIGPFVTGLIDGLQEEMRGMQVQMSEA